MHNILQAQVQAFPVPRIFAHNDKVTVYFGIALWCEVLSKILIC